MKAGSQCHRILTLARARGPIGVSAIDFDGSRHVADGGPRITRLAARIQDLEERYGCTFDASRFRHGVKVYCLVSESPVGGSGAGGGSGVVGAHASGSVVDTGPPEGALFDLPAESPEPRSAIHDEAA